MEDEKDFEYEWEIFKGGIVGPEKYFSKEDKERCKHFFLASRRTLREKMHHDHLHPTEQAPKYPTLDFDNTE